MSSCDLRHSLATSSVSVTQSALTFLCASLIKQHYYRDAESNLHNTDETIIVMRSATYSQFSEPNSSFKREQRGRGVEPLCLKVGG